MKIIDVRGWYFWVGAVLVVLFWRLFGFGGCGGGGGGGELTGGFFLGREMLV
jgi:hypothetical protein